VFGILGPNGAGKTTAILLTLGFIKPTSGSVIIEGKQQDGLRNIQRHINFLPSVLGLYDQLSAREHIILFAKLNGLQLTRAEVDRILVHEGVGDTGNRRVGGFSTGMLQRLELAIVSLRDSPITMMDEPSAYLDIDGVGLVKQKIRAWKAKGKTVVISTHQVEQFGEVFTHLAVINKGRLMWSGAIGEATGTGSSEPSNLKPSIIYSRLVGGDMEGQTVENQNH
jgi:ABC-2 type transport system ATP-binding protein